MSKGSAAKAARGDDTPSRSSQKRLHDDIDTQDTPSKRARAFPATEDLPERPGNTHEPNEPREDDINGHEATPKSTPRRGRPPKAKGTTPSKTTRALFATPTKSTTLNTPKKQAADRSARRKSARALIESVVDDGDDDNLARQIYESSEGGDTDGEDPDGVDPDIKAADAPATPSKKIGRPRKIKSPTPPRDLPLHEQYFYDNKPGRPKTSDNTLEAVPLLSHEEFFEILKTHEDSHKEDLAYLQSLHAGSFPQWRFELAQGFGLCLYGFGSKRSLLRQFVGHLKTRAVVVNGYAPNASMRDILGVVATAVAPATRIPSTQPSTMIQAILPLLITPLTLVVNSIDAAPLRKPATQNILAQLAAHPLIRFVCSADTPDFPLLWDVGLRSSFNFAFHDCTTLAPFSAAVEIDVVDEVHELLGREARRVNGREGVMFVLKSLPENARNLFRLIVGEVLVAREEESDEEAGVEYRMCYNKAVEEFICSSEMAFRTLLKEFHDHQMIMSRKDALGTEILGAPFQKEELEAIFEDLMS